MSKDKKDKKVKDKCKKYGIEDLLDFCIYCEHYIAESEEEE